MIQVRPLIATLQAVFFSAALLLSGCGQSAPTPAPTDAAQKTAEAPATAKGAAATTQPTGDSQKQTRLYKDFMNREVEIPAHAERVIFIGNTAGDLLALGVKPVGLNMIDAKPTVFGGELQGVEDVGHPGDPEKMLALNPDLIILGVNIEEERLQVFSKIAPTVAFDKYRPVKERLLTLGDILGRQPEAKAWIADYEKQTEQFWSNMQAQGQVKPNETASVFIFYDGGKSLYALGTQGLSSSLYHEKGFKPTGAIQKMLDNGVSFEEFSKERLGEVAGDHLFLMVSLDDSKAEFERFIENPLWKNLPAVKNGHAYLVDAKWGYDDAITKQRVLGELPTIMQAKK